MGGWEAQVEWKVEWNQSFLNSILGLVFKRSIITFLTFPYKILIFPILNLSLKLLVLFYSFAF
jgi:hypothetical protein